PAEQHRGAGRKDGAGDADHLHADDPAAHGSQAPRAAGGRMSVPQPSPAGRPSPRDCANAIRLLAVDAVQAANPGPPGAPMGMADIAEVPWQRYLRHDPAAPQWPDRDRFVLSNGHASMLLYALLHLTGYDLPIDELRRFRQLHSRTPGHPEFGETPGV